MGSILSLDYGLKRIGVAFSDPMRSFAFRYGKIENKNLTFTLSEIKKIIEEKETDLIIIGLPLNMDKTNSQMSARVKGFADKLSKAVNLEVKFVDERLSSFEAEENLREAGMNAKKMKDYVDAESARIILQEFLNNKL